MRVSRVLLAVCLFTPIAQAQEASAATMNTGDDVGLGDGAVLLTLGLARLTLELAPPPAPRRSIGAGAFDTWTRDRLRLDEPRSADVASDALVTTLLASAVAAPALTVWTGGARERLVLAASAESLMATSTLTALTKVAVRRGRPPLADEPSPSFFSGHTAMAFGSATLLSLHAYEFDWLSPKTRWLVPATAYAAAGGVGYLRLAADQHWGSDVLVGAAVGTATSWLVYQIRTRWMN